jgi:nitroimidazol reductase NimA-like FMN-containing flavoprotein (pyridoxamine 5'-phosphate oxidase superfamily)
MYENTQEIRDLQRLLDRSQASGGEHLRGIFSEKRRMTAERLCELMQGVQVLNLATVSASCEPLVAPVDGLFFHARFYFGSSPDSVRFRHLRRRLQVSASHTRGEDVAVIVHGRAELVDTAAPEHAAFRAHLIETYGEGWESWGGGSQYARIEPRKMFAAQMHG